ncbi:MAG: hypothetical protein H6613_00360 [Ignavibacteriales bacterium]|nr:hypothetical protein [Ignavibacteriota bacterium]MCB0746456.1 hypothetical protein [Ignavibacteriota bacterium]MCB9247095.1 hypothetical protein [Ignavibacteriales bacterium]
MKKMYKTDWELSHEDALPYLENEVKNIDKSLKVDFQAATNTVSVLYKGQEFDSLSSFSNSYHDTIVIDPKKHGHLSNNDLEVFGTYLHIDDIGMNLPSNYFSINLKRPKLTPDFLTWLFVDDSIITKFLIEPAKIQAVFPYDGIRQQKLWDYLNHEPDIEILNNGIIDAGDVARQRMANSKIDSPIPIRVIQFGKVTVKMNVGFPDTVNDLIEYVKKFKNKVYSNVK